MFACSPEPSSVQQLSPLFGHSLRDDDHPRIDPNIGVSTHAINKKVLCVRLWKGTRFCPSFFFLLSFSLTQNRALKKKKTCLGVFLHCALCCLITWATHSHPFRAPVYCGCQPGPTGVLIHSSWAVDQQCANPLAAALLLHCTELDTCVRVRPSLNMLPQTK